MRISLFARLAGFVGDWCLRADGSVDVYVGPNAPKGFENNWVKTVAGFRKGEVKREANVEWRGTRGE